MSNNTVLNPGSSGDVINTEDNSGVKTQIVKPAYGTPPVGVDTTHGLPIQEADGADATFGAQADGASAGDTTTTTYMALFKRLLQRITTLIGLLPSALVSNRLDVNLGAAPATVTVDSELPAAAALADGSSNPTTPLVGSCLHGYNGATWDRIHVAKQSADLAAVSITAIATVATPDSGKKLRLISGTISVSAAASVLFEDNSAGTTVFRTPKLLADTPYNFVVRGGQGYLLSVNDHVLKATASAAASITGTLDYSSE